MTRRSAALVSLLALTAAVYARAVGYWFLPWDDNAYVYRNPLIVSLDWRHLAAMWNVAAIGNYMPVTLMSYAIDFQCWGMQAAGYRAVNIGWHLLNTWLCYRLLRRSGLPAWPAWAAAALFALHPVQVESVVWIAERKNLLATTGTLAAVLAYSHADEPRCGRAWWLASCLVGLLAVLSKGSAVILPVVCVAWDRWVARRPWHRTWRCTMPLWLMALGGGLLTLWASRVDAPVPPWHGGLGVTLWTLPRVWLRYLQLTVWPAGLSFWYELEASRAWTDARAWGGLVCLVMIGVALRRWQRRQPRIAWWTCWSIAALLPTANLVPLLPWMHDRYLHLPLIGLCGLAAEGLAAADGVSQRGVVRWWCRGALAAALVALGVVTWHRVAVWRDAQTLWSDTLRHAPSAVMPKMLLGDALGWAGRQEEARQMYASARQSAVPNDAKMRLALADAAYARGEWGVAVEWYEAVLAYGPQTSILARLGAIADQLGQPAIAAVWYRQALRYQPWQVSVRHRLALALEAQGGAAATEAGRQRLVAEAWQRDYQRLREAHLKAAAVYRCWRQTESAARAAAAADAAAPPMHSAAPGRDE